MPLRALLIALLAALLLAPAAVAAPLDDYGYLRFADAVVARFESGWDEQARYYRGGGAGSPNTNANILLTHAVAALRGHEGAARNDHRARMLARRLVESPPFVTTPGSGSQRHAPGFSSSMTDPAAEQHLVFDADLIDGLAMAYKGRRALGLSEETAALIRSRIDAVARSPFWRVVRLNQFNWHAEVYAAHHTVTGSTTMLRQELARHLRRFVAGVGPRAGMAGNLGPGMRFHYLPHAPAARASNVDSAEYANIVLSFSRFYEQARRAGMPQPPPASLRLLREWVKRALCGYWTHAGYLNWDTGLGFERWHQNKKIALSAQALIGIASADALQPDARYGRWAKHLFDRGLELYARWMERSPDGLPPGLLFDLYTAPQSRGSAMLGAARMAANAARAAAAGLGRARAAQPPALYAFDPDIGRLAVTTPAYNTAIVAVNQGAIPYGGIEPARLFDGDQEVAANVGGVAPSSFGMLLRDLSGRTVAASQVGRRRLDRRVTPLRLTRAPAGAGASAATRVGRAFAGPFSELRAAGAVATRTHVLRSTHRFTPEAIETTWTATRRAGSMRLYADVLFPSYGAAEVVAVLDSGERVPIGESIPLERVAYFHLRGERSGYAVVPLTRPAGATARLLATTRQRSNPRPGPTLAIGLARGQRFRRVSLRARYAPVASAAAAAALAAG